MNKEMNELVNIIDDLLSIVSRMDDRVRELEDKEANADFPMSQGERSEILILTERIEGFRDYFLK